MPELVFDIPAENPEKPHVADDMKIAAVQEHAGEERQKGFQRSIAVPFKRQLNVRGGKRVGLHERLGRRRRKRDLMDEYDNVCRDQ